MLPTLHSAGQAQEDESSSCRVDGPERSYSDRRSRIWTRDMLKKIRAVAAVLMVLSVVTATVVQGFGPKMRQSIHESRRLVWGDTREGSRVCAC